MYHSKYITYQELTGTPARMVAIENHTDIVLGIALVEEADFVERGGLASAPFHVVTELFLLVRLHRFQLRPDVLPLGWHERSDCGIELSTGFAHRFATAAAGNEGCGQITKHGEWVVRAPPGQKG